MKFIPLYDKIVAIKIENENKIGEIYIPTNENNIIKGKVVEIGIGNILENGKISPLIVKVDDNILFKDGYNVEKYKVGNIEYYFVKEKDIISIIK
ncbi:co-chaperone GroES [Candidatus Carsonella ruddii]|uniref:10 kDa chaperonin n=1 Tax=Candidatus Carsonella ruddii (Diaphorina cf. continua) TaxID=2661587 RepID=A0A7R7AAU9_CARRU|nr:co-chaperone GroES [Candidatus Carsonella ruddii (Diaphorina cf. continua)]BCG49280.1 co-chaperone GroES [Candidatus Carsonella ruddii (Diaphorina cf. continua)]